MNSTPRIFISYSWTNSEHIKWVLSLAERLAADGVDVTLDKWSLKEGQDKYNFMETMVKSEEINKVLLILDKMYAEKAEQRSGGVGTEAQIISPKIYNDVSQEKFVPVVAECDENNNPFVPTFLQSRIYIDLSKEERYEENYESLLRNIFQRPAHIKPKLGIPPSYLFDEAPLKHKTSSIIRSFDNVISKNPNKINSVLREFLSEFFLNLKNYTLKLESRDINAVGKQVYDNIMLYTALRNDFIEFFDKITKEEYKFDIEILIKFLEDLPLLKQPLDERTSWTNVEFDNFRFIIHELFLYLISICLKNGNYQIIEELFYSRYHFKDKFDRNKEPGSFTELYNYIEITDLYYRATFSNNLLSSMADMMIKRIPTGFSKDHLIDADYLCHYIAKLNHDQWFPITYIYRTRGRFDVFDRLSSTRHFEKVKKIFNVSNAEELKEKINISKSQDNGERIKYSNSWDFIRPMHELVNVNNIAMFR